jgi:hypothetical protein
LRLACFHLSFLGEKVARGRSSTSTRTDLDLRGVEEMQTEANVVRAYRELPNGFRSCEAVRLKLADEGQDISAEKIRDVIYSAPGLGAG